MKEEIIQEVKQTVLDIDPNAEVILFGSHARGDAHKQSDWDFLILTELEEDYQTEKRFWDALYEIELKKKCYHKCNHSLQKEKISSRYLTIISKYSEGGGNCMNSTKDDYIQYRVERAWESLKEAKLLFEHEHYNTAINRIYYACFYMVFALLLKSGHNMHTHAGVKSLFNQHFAAPQLIDERYCKIL